MLIYLQLILSSIGNAYFQDFRNESKNYDHEKEKIKIFISIDENYILISDENYLKLCLDDDKKFKLKKAKFYYIESAEEDIEGFKNFLTDLKTSELVNWEKYNEIAIKWQISRIPNANINPLNFPYYSMLNIDFGCNYLTMFLSQNLKSPSYKISQRNRETRKVVNFKQFGDNQQNFYDLIKMIDDFSGIKNFSKISKLKKNY